MVKISSVTKTAYQIVEKELRSCYDEFGIVAGRGHYDEYWTRDASFGCLGALELGDHEVVERYLKFLASTQRKDGMISFLSRKYLAVSQYAPWKIKINLKPRFKSHKTLGLTDVIDSNPYFVIVFSALLKKSDKKTAATLLGSYKANIEKSLFWCLTKIPPNESLAHEGFIAGWNDGIYKSGKVLITNVLFWKAFKEWEEICQKYDLEFKEEFADVSKRIKGSLVKDFFNGDFFIDWVDSKKHAHFDSNANFLAVWWELTNKFQANKILNYALKNLLEELFVKVAYPPYPWYRVEIWNRLCGMADYINGNGCFWLEPAYLYALCLNKTGKHKEAKKQIESLSRLVMTDNGVHEVYDSKTKLPLKRWNYKAEYPYARGSALFILTYNSILWEW